jgi:hypothetical protein
VFKFTLLDFILRTCKTVSYLIDNFTHACFHRSHRSGGFRTRPVGFKLLLFINRIFVILINNPFIKSAYVLFHYVRTVVASVKRVISIREVTWYQIGF